jgi:hypothetical protein
MTVKIKFLMSGEYHAGEFKFLDLSQITQLKIARLRNTCELLATTPENPQPNTPYVIARRDREYELQAILTDLQQLKRETREVIYEITDTEAHRVPA